MPSIIISGIHAIDMNAMTGTYLMSDRRFRPSGAYVAYCLPGHHAEQGGVREPLVHLTARRGDHHQHHCLLHDMSRAMLAHCTP